VKLQCTLKKYCATTFKNKFLCGLIPTSKHERIFMSKPNPARVKQQTQAIQMRAKGASVRDIAKFFNVTSACVYIWLRDDYANTKALAKIAEKEAAIKVKEMAAMRRAGATLQQIGFYFSTSGENVRQILLKAGVAAPTRKVSKTAIAKQQAQQAKAARIKKLWGLTIEQYEAIRQKYGPHSEPASPIRKFTEQRRNARMRGVEWRITFAEWWGVWMASDKYNKRGRGEGYCMARLGDTGPYSVDNVEIISNSQNISDYQARKKVTKTF
jgi:transcriptional regulator